MINAISDVEIQNMIEKLNEKIKLEQELNPFVKKVLKRACSKLETLPKLRAIKKYDLIFIGKQGCGKTTAIVNLAELIDIPSNSKEDLKNTSLLKTGSGGTTAPEVSIIQIDNSEESKIVVECCEVDEFKEIIRTYIKKIFTKFVKESSSNQILKEYDNEITLSREYDRIVEGMCSDIIDNKKTELEEKFKDKKTNFSYLPHIIEDLIVGKDTAVDNLIEKEDEIIDDISNCIIKEYMSIETEDYYNDHSILEIPYEGNSNYKRWLKETFDCINNGTYPGLLIPKRYISLYQLRI